jgi:hypothetical protein
MVSAYHHTARRTPDANARRPMSMRAGGEVR